MPWKIDRVSLLDYPIKPNILVNVERGVADEVMVITEDFWSPDVVELAVEHERTELIGALVGVVEMTDRVERHLELWAGADLDFREFSPVKRAIIQSKLHPELIRLK